MAPCVGRCACPVGIAHSVVTTTGPQLHVYVCSACCIRKAARHALSAALPWRQADREHLAQATIHALHDAACPPLPRLQFMAHASSSMSALAHLAVAHTAAPGASWSHPNGRPLTLSLMLLSAVVAPAHAACACMHFMLGMHVMLGMGIATRLGAPWGRGYGA